MKDRTRGTRKGERRMTGRNRGGRMRLETGKGGRKRRGRNKDGRRELERRGTKKG